MIANTGVADSRRSIAPLSRMSPSPVRMVSLAETFKSKELLPIYPERIWKIEAGVVRSLTWDRGGRMMTLGFWGEGDVVGKPFSQMNPYQLECLTRVQVSPLKLDSSYLQEALLVHAWKSEKFLSIIHQLSVSDRFLSLLEWLSAEFGKPLESDRGKLLNLRMTHQDFADTIGTSRVTITRLLNQFEREGIVERFCRTHRQKMYLQCHLLCRQSLILKG